MIINTMVSKHVGFSPEKVQYFKALIIQKKEDAEETISNLEKYVESGNGIQEGYRAFENRDEDAEAKIKALKTIGERREYIRKLNGALSRIENGTYGICHMTGKLINEKRLERIPHATLSIEAENQRGSEE